jgi:hypothetical protein
VVGHEREEMVGKKMSLFFFFCRNSKYNICATTARRKSA